MKWLKHVGWVLPLVLWIATLIASSEVEVLNMGEAIGGIIGFAILFYLAFGLPWHVAYLVAKRAVKKALASVPATREGG